MTSTNIERNPRHKTLREMMKIREIKQGTALYSDALTLRHRLFFKDFDLPFSVTADELEPASLHVALTEDNNLLAYGRLSPLAEKQMRISQIVVNPSHRRKGYATKIVCALLGMAEEREANEVVLNSQLTVVSLYEKLGFRKVGKTYRVKLTGVEHQRMRYGLHRDKRG